MYISFLQSHRSWSWKVFECDAFLVVWASSTTSSCLLVRSVEDVWGVILFVGLVGLAWRSESCVCVYMFEYECMCVYVFNTRQRKLKSHPNSMPDQHARPCLHPAAQNNHTRSSRCGTDWSWHCGHGQSRWMVRAKSVPACQGTSVRSRYHLLSLCIHNTVFRHKAAYTIKQAGQYRPFVLHDHGQTSGCVMSSRITSVRNQARKHVKDGQVPKMQRLHTVFLDRAKRDMSEAVLTGEMQDLVRLHAIQ